jgi:hypothetical protein
MILPYQEGDSIYDTETSTEVLNNSDSMETGINNRMLHTQEVFMVHHPLSPLVPLETLNIRSLDESDPIYHPSPRGTIVKLKARNKPERG